MKEMKRFVKRIVAGGCSALLTCSMLFAAAMPVFAQESSVSEADPQMVAMEAQDLTPAEDAVEELSADDLYDGDALVHLDGLYMPDVTAEMSDASYWAAKVDDPDEVLAGQADIDAINQAILYGDGTNMYDLVNWSQETYDGVALNTALANSAASDAQYFYTVGVRFDDDGSRFPSWEAAKEKLFDPLIENCKDPDAETEMPVKYAVVTNRTCMLAYPTDHPLYDDPTDPDFDYLFLSMLRVNEPLVLKARSADGKYYMAISSCVSGWVAAEDIAICQDKDEWYAAWNFTPEKTLVVYADKIYTETSNFAPEVSNRMLPMGTCLELAEESEYTGLVINRRAYNNHVVWMPVRQEDGSYTKVLALIGENQEVSEGFLPLTSGNLLTVMLNQLGDAYGWGGMLQSEDCSGYTRDVYKCFGIEMARNTTWQANQPVYKFNLSGMDSETKADIIKDLPPGSLLIFSGHLMMYLGEENGKLYVISSMSDVAVDGGVKRVRGGIINTLEVRRGSGITWLEALHTAEIPYYPQDYERTFTYKTVAGDGQEWTKGSEATADFTFCRTVNNSAAGKHFQGILVDGEEVSAENYTIEEDSVIIHLLPAFLQELATGSHIVSAVFDDGNAAEAEISILSVIDGLTLAPEYATLPTEDGAGSGLLQLTAAITPDTTTQDKGILWSSSNENIATVDENGQVTALRYGSAVITATAKADSQFRANCTIQTLYHDVLGSGIRGAADYIYWFNPVYWAADNDITRGFDNVYFGPELDCTREQMITFLWRLVGQPEPAEVTESPFTDVWENTYYYNAVLWAYENGITNGYSSGPLAGQFGVGQQVSREDTVTFIYRLAGRPAVSDDDLLLYTFTDIEDGAYYQIPVAWAAMRHITNGYTSGPDAGKFGVGYNVLRKDIVTFLYRYAS